MSWSYCCCFCLFFIRLSLVNIIVADVSSLLILHRDFRSSRRSILRQQWWFSTEPWSWKSLKLIIFVPQTIRHDTFLKINRQSTSVHTYRSISTISHWDEHIPKRKRLRQATMKSSPVTWSTGNSYISPSFMMPLCHPMSSLLIVRSHLRTFMIRKVTFGSIWNLQVEFISPLNCKGSSVIVSTRHRRRREDSIGLFCI